MHQLWQTKRGPPDDLHIIDWIEFDTDVTFYPDPDRDNFGQAFGMLDYNFRWHVGDRLTVLSDGIFDFFDLGQKEVVIGAYLDRPPRGSLYVGVRFLEGPINSQILTMSYNYQMSPKWVSSFGFNIDMAEPRNVGELLRITRVGESLLVSGGFTYDPARSSVGAVLTVEPRLLPKSKLGVVGGDHIPPPAPTDWNSTAKRKVKNAKCKMKNEGDGPSRVAAVLNFAICNLHSSFCIVRKCAWPPAGVST